MEYNETAQKFAANYCNKYVKVAIDACPGAMWLHGEDQLARVIGYCNVPYSSKIIVVEFESNFGISVNNCVMKDYVFNSESRSGYVWIVNLCDIEIVESTNKCVKITIPYPHRCKKCNSPARNIGLATLCSNVRCKDLKSLIKKLKINVPKFIKSKYLDTENYIICPDCICRAMGHITNYDRAGTLPSEQILVCPNNHRWNYKVLSGHKLRYYTNTYIYNSIEKKWQLSSQPHQK